MSVETQLDYFRNELPSAVKLVAVSKFKPLQAVLDAYGAGQRDFGESRPKEMMEKALSSPSDISWHFIGHLQTNKVRMVVPYVAMIESVDSLRLLKEIDRFSESVGKVTDCLLEVHISTEGTKQGFLPGEIREAVEESVKFKNIRIRGLMGMASNVDDEMQVRGEFRALRSLFDEIRAISSSSDSQQLRFRLSAFDTLSMGMSGDWRIAVEEGSTIVRIGTAIFGVR